MRSWPMTASVGTPRKRCISIPTRRKTWRQVGGVKGGWLMFPYAAYATSITSILLYLLLYISRHHLCFAAARIRCTAARGYISYDVESSALSVSFFHFYFNGDSFCTLHVARCTCSWRLQRRAPLIALILLHIPRGISNTLNHWYSALFRIVQFAWSILCAIRWSSVPPERLKLFFIYYIYIYAYTYKLKRKTFEIYMKLNYIVNGKVKSSREAAPCLLYRYLFRKTGRQPCLGAYQYLHVHVLLGFSRGWPRIAKWIPLAAALGAHSALLHLSRDFILSFACSGNSRVMLNAVVQFHQLFVCEFGLCQDHHKMNNSINNC